MAAAAHARLLTHLACVVGFAGATVLFHDDFVAPVAASAKWVYAADFGWDAAAKAPVAGKLATHHASSLALTGSGASVGFGGRSFTLADLGGSYTARLHYAPGVLSPMDEDVAVVLCNVAPDAYEGAPTDGPGGTSFTEVISAWILKQREVGYTLDSRCVGAELSDSIYNFRVKGAVDAPPAERTWAAGTCDPRLAADENGKAAVAISLRVDADEIFFSTTFGADCQLEQAVSLAGAGFDPSLPAYVYVATDEDNLNHVEIEKVEVVDAAGDVAWAETFDAGGAGWASPHWMAAGCQAEPQIASIFPVADASLRRRPVFLLPRRRRGRDARPQVRAVPRAPDRAPGGRGPLRGPGGRRRGPRAVRGLLPRRSEHPRDRLERRAPRVRRARRFRVVVARDAALRRLRDARRARRAREADRAPGRHGRRRRRVLEAALPRRPGRRVGVGRRVP